MPHPTPDQVAELKRMIVGSKRLDEVVAYFFDHFGENPAFHDAGRPLMEIPEPLQQAVGRVVAAVAGETTFRTHWTILESPSTNIVHGSVIINGKHAVLVWLPEIMVGVVALTVDPRTSKTTFARIKVKIAGESTAIH